MSDVLKRYRNETELQFRVNAVELQIEISKYVMRDKVMPKKWRYAIGYPLINKVDEMVDNITYANSIFADSEEKLIQRKMYQSLAIANCHQIQNKLIKMIKCIETVKPKQIETIIDKLSHEAELLIAWRKSSKVIIKK